jgi:OFA family oxalate/formate antiporter-like MFS transporter
MINRLPFYYGWIIVAISTVSGAFNTGLMVWGLGVFVSPMQDDLGWSRTTFFLPLAVGGVVSSVLGPILGRYADKKNGPRFFFLFGVLLTGISTMYLREIHSVTPYIIVFGIGGGIGRYLIQLVMYIIPKWFIRRRGLAQAISLAGMIGAGPLIFPLLLQFLLTSIGWRDTWFVMGVALVIIGVPAALLIVRQPEDLGLRPDGDSEDSVTNTKSVPGRVIPLTEVSLTSSQAVRTRQFWVVIVSVSLGMMAIRGSIPNFVPFFVSQGLSGSIAAGTVSAYAVSAMVAGFFWGAMSDRFGHRLPYVIACFLVSSSLALMAFTQSTVVAYLFMAYLGVVLAGFWVLQALVVANTFGRVHIGAIRGVMQPFNNAAMFGGPLLFAAIYDVSNDYTWIFAFASVAFLASALAAYFLRPFSGATEIRGK